jgi:hypothetical protein
VRHVDANDGDHHDGDRDADRNVDEEEPIPRKLFGDETAEERPDRGRDHCRGARDEHRTVLQPFRKHFVADGEYGRRNQTSRESLDRSPNDQGHEVVGQRAAETGEREGERR